MLANEIEIKNTDCMGQCNKGSYIFFSSDLTSSNLVLRDGNYFPLAMFSVENKLFMYDPMLIKFRLLCVGITMF
jgi:hypothetical protein